MKKSFCSKSEIKKKNDNKKKKKKKSKTQVPGAAERLAIFIMK